MEELRAPTIGDAAWLSIYATSIFSARPALTSLWDDAGWYDKWGTWNGPDWKQNQLSTLRKHDMKWVLWYPTFWPPRQSTVAQQHPDWIIPGQDTLEQSIPAHRRLADVDYSTTVSTLGGDYQWRYDIAPAASANDTDALAADQNFRDCFSASRATTRRAASTLATAGVAGSATTSLV
jgi:hypothetical protein